jgi:hypothetical protein
MGKYSGFRNSYVQSDFDKVVLAHLQNQTSGRSLLLVISSRVSPTRRWPSSWHREERHPLARGQIPARRPHQLPPGRKFKRYFIGEIPGAWWKIHGSSHLGFGEAGPLLFTVMVQVVDYLCLSFKCMLLHILEGVSGGRFVC